jgi:glycosyltransferase involved in cell wall biosynthesis
VLTLNWFLLTPQYAYTFPVDKMREPLRRLLESRKFDILVFHHLFVAELADEAPDMPALLAEDNIESDIAQRLCTLADNAIHKLRDWLVWQRLLAFERHWVRRFPVCVAVSDRDAALLRAMSPTSRVYVVPNGVDAQFFSPLGNSRDPETLLFFGTLDYGPNADGLIWFCREVFPRLRESHLSVRLEVVGLNPPPRVLDLERIPGVHITGFVPDIRPKLWSATMCVVPLQVGGGTRLKILEALAAGCPVISTSVGAEGLDLVDGEHLLIADDADGFARGAIALLGSEDLRNRLARAGRQVVAQRYDWQQIALRLEDACLWTASQHRHIIR